MTAGNENGAHLKSDASGHLDIQQGEARGAKVLDKIVERGFGGVRDAVEHGFTGEISSDSNTVDAADEFIFLPEFKAVCVPNAVEVGIRGDKFGSDPGGPSTGGGSGTFGHDFSKNAVDGDLKGSLA